MAGSPHPSRTARHRTTRRSRPLRALAPCMLLLSTLAGCFFTPTLDKSQECTHYLDPQSCEWRPSAGNGSLPPISTRSGGNVGQAWPAYGTSFLGGPCGTAPVVDGRFGGLTKGKAHHEWSCGASLVGLYGRMYLRVVGDRLFALNDWRLRTDAPVCAAMYNQFWFSGAFGSFSLRVYGDNHIEARHNGVLVPGAKGAAGFGSSPDMDKKHAIFEFSVQLPTLGIGEQILLSAKDPANNFNWQGSGSGGTDDGECGAEDAPMVDEPMVFQLTAVSPNDAGPAVRVEAADVDALPLTGVEPWPLVPGEQAVVQGGGLAVGEGAEIAIGGLVVESPAWLGNCVIVRVPDLPTGSHKVIVRRAGAVSVPLTVQVK